MGDVSWSATLEDDRGHEEGWWNCTHNLNGMIGQALEDCEIAQVPDCDGPLGKAIGPAWWKQLHGTTGADGAAYLSRIVAALEARPDRYRAMNPSNGWGDYDKLLVVLREMRDRVPEWPTTWSVHG